MGKKSAFTFTTLKYQAGQFITVEGQRAERFFIIQQGTVRISKEIETIHEDDTLGPGDFFALIAAMANQAQFESAQALSTVVVIAITCASFEGVITTLPRVALKIIQKFSQRMRFLDNQLAERTLKESNEEVDGAAVLFRAGEYYDKQRRFEQALYCYRQYMREYPGGTANAAVSERIAALHDFAGPANESDDIFVKDRIIFAEGETGDILYVINSGSVRITKIIGGKEVVLAVLAKGAMFGEMAILESKPRSASAIACENCSLLGVRIANFEQIAATQPAMARRLTETLAERLWFIDRQLANTELEDPVARMVDMMAIHLEKEHIPLDAPRKHVFSFGVEELAKMVGVPSDKKTVTVQAVLRFDSVSTTKDGKLTVADVREVEKQRQFYRRMQARKKTIEKQRQKN
jgi:CRP-like cAMP-binding protein